MAVEQLAPGTYRVDAIPIPSAISVLLLQDAGGWVLVDTGIAASAARIRAALAGLGGAEEPERLTSVYLTHHHPDHVDGLPSLRRWAPQAKVAAHPHEAEILRGERPRDPSSSPFFQRLAGGTPVPRVEDAQDAPEGHLLAGWRTIHTPGHTLGHTSLINDQHGILFTGDAFGALLFKQRVGVRPFLCSDRRLARQSAEKLLEEDYETVVFSHGRVLRSGAKAALQKVVARCRY